MESSARRSPREFVSAPTWARRMRGIKSALNHQSVRFCRGQPINPRASVWGPVGQLWRCVLALQKTMSLVQHEVKWQHEAAVLVEQQFRGQHCTREGFVARTLALSSVSRQWCCSIRRSACLRRLRLPIPLSKRFGRGCLIDEFDIHCPPLCWRPSWGSLEGGGRGGGRFEKCGGLCANGVRVTTNMFVRDLDLDVQSAADDVNQSGSSPCEMAVFCHLVIIHHLKNGALGLHMSTQTLGRTPRRTERGPPEPNVVLAAVQPSGFGVRGSRFRELGGWCYGVLGIWVLVFFGGFWVLGFGFLGCGGCFL